jgi:phospholipid/cholesterol/gamma-HCH transport system substrate-binding protein
MIAWQEARRFALAFLTQARVNLADAAAEAKAASADVRSMVAKLEAPSADFATNGLPQITEAVMALQASATSLERLTNEIEANPRGLVSKAPAAEKEVKP